MVKQVLAPLNLLMASLSAIIMLSDTCAASLYIMSVPDPEPPRTFDGNIGNLKISLNICTQQVFCN